MESYDVITNHTNIWENAICTSCGNVFKKPKTKNKKFCSYQCRFARATRITFSSCKHCGRKFSHRITDERRKFCHIDCSKAWMIEKRNRLYGGKVSPSTAGAINELLVATDLMKKGFHVYRALSPNAPSDLIILVGDKSHRVEVTCGYKTTTNGEVSVKWCPHDENLYDIIAVVVNDGSIWYKGLPEQTKVRALTI